MPHCPQCRHPWDEHAGGGADPDAAADQLDCGECEYELQHGFLPPGTDLCRLRAFHTRVQVVLAEVSARLVGQGARVRWVAPTPHGRTARVEVQLGDGRGAVLVEDGGSVGVVVDHHDQRLLDDDEERQLVRDPLAALTAAVVIAGRSAPGARRSRAARLFEEHSAAPFPERLRGREVAGVDAVLLDADITGRVSTWLGSGGRWPAGEERQLVRSMADLEAVLAELTDPAEVAHFRGLRALARAALDGAGGAWLEAAARR